MTAFYYMGYPEKGTTVLPVSIFKEKNTIDITVQIH